LILREHGSNSSATTRGNVACHEGWAAHGVLRGPAGIPGIGPGIGARGEQRAVLPLTHVRLGTQGQIARMQRDHGIRRPEGVGHATRPRVGRGILHEARSDGIPIQIPERSQGRGVRLHQTCPVAPLPEVAPPPAGLVVR
jgi:hypothetical protein